MVLRLYVDLMSQPCRAVTLFLRANAIPCEEISIAIRKGEHLTEKFAQINPFQKLPALYHDGFIVTESVAMLPYLCRTFPVPDHWYPNDDAQKIASIQSYMSWQHLNLRSYGSQYFRHKLFAFARGEAVDEQKLSGYAKGLAAALTQIETIWLKHRPFIATGDLTIADLLAVCELEQPGVVGYDVRAGHPKIATYMELVRSRLQPHYDDVHSILYKMTAKLQGNQPKAKL